MSPALVERRRADVWRIAPGVAMILIGAGNSVEVKSAPGDTAANVATGTEKLLRGRR
jgi:hypothetical protein